MKPKEITADNQIEMFLHCGKCLLEWKLTSGVSPKDFARIEVGWTPFGIQAWCHRHEANIMNVDFEGMKHKAITYCYEEEDIMAEISKKLTKGKN